MDAAKAAAQSARQNNEQVDFVIQLDRAAVKEEIHFLLVGWAAESYLGKSDHEKHINRNEIVLFWTSK